MTLWRRSSRRHWRPKIRNSHAFSMRSTRCPGPLRTDAPDTEALSNTLRRAVMCAVKQSLLDRELPVVWL